MGRPVRMKLKKRPVFEGMMPAHSPEEKEYLRKDIILNGVLNDIIVWRQHNVIIEGHTRYDIAMSIRGMKFGVKFMDFATEEEAVIWALQHAFSRRNLDLNNRKLIAARLYEMLKKPLGYNPKGKVDQSDLPSGETREEVAKMTGMSPAGVQRALQFKERLDAAPEEDKPKIMAGEIKPPSSARRRAPKKQGSVIFSLETLNSLCGKMERYIDQMCHAYELYDHKRKCVIETPEVLGLRREFRAWKKNFEAEQKRLAKQYSERNGG